ncbi:MAG: hypothetical protein FJW38_26395 [Acidobacteria bacterium]|nr:hypothetical protein [Acidobacteriota bacterium]
MKKESKAENGVELRPEYDLAKLRDGVRGKYYKRAIAGTNLVLIDSDLAAILPTSAAVNQALRAVAEAAKSAVLAKRRRKQA